MPRPSSKRSKADAGAGNPAWPVGGRRGAGAQRDQAGTTPVGAASDVMRLVAEVEALRAELEWTRAKVQELEAKVDVDPLLGILNRRGFERELARSLAFVKRYGTPAALLYVDLDGFKPVNDIHGHAAGDRMLEAVAATLSRNIRASDVVGRLGGDEFAVLMWNASEADAVMKAMVIENLVAATTIGWDDEVLSVGASVGVAVLRHLDGTADVLACADRAMYARKAERGSADPHAKHPRDQTPRRSPLTR